MTTIIPPHQLGLCYTCPACGNYYWQSSYGSYSNFSSTRFSDGSSVGGYAPEWITRCPKCGRCFAKKYLVATPCTIYNPANRYLYGSDRENRKQVFCAHYHPTKRICNKSGWHCTAKGVKECALYEHKDPEDEKGAIFTPERMEKFGRMDTLFDEDIPPVERWEGVLKEGLFFPDNVWQDFEKEEFITQARKELWIRYNRFREDVSDERYEALCRTLIEKLCHSFRPQDEKLLTLAELYRNVGDFDECLSTLEKISEKSRLQDYVDCIRREALAKNTRTVELPEPQWKRRRREE